MWNIRSVSKIDEINHNCIFYTILIFGLENSDDLCSMNNFGVTNRIDGIKIAKLYLVVEVFKWICELYNMIHTIFVLKDNLLFSLGASFLGHFD